MANEFPIQFVQFRDERDDFLAEGGGNSTLPTWVNDETISANATRMQSHLNDLSTKFENRIYDLPILTIVDLHEKATAKSHRDSIYSLLDVESKHNVLSTLASGHLLVKVDSVDDLHRISSRVEVTNNLSKSRKKGLAAIQDINPYHVQIEDNIEDAAVVKIQLANYQNSIANERSVRIFNEFCRAHNIEVEELDYISELRLYKAERLNREQVQSLATMDCVLSVMRMPTIEFLAAPDIEESDICTMIPVDDCDYPSVGVMDSGIEQIDYLQPWVDAAEDNAADLLKEDIDKRHGTAVASIINYGDLLENQNLTACSPCKITSCVVNGNIHIYEHELVKNIKTAVANHPEIKIWNLSQGMDCPISDNQYSHLAIALDGLQKQNNILICKSAGNIENPDGNTSMRITNGAESIMSLVVGSIALNKKSERDAEPNCRSPFSRIGPGVENVTKPDLVHYGGNIDSHISAFSIYGRQVRCFSGTSFSTPRIASLAANLEHYLGNKFSPLLVKAMLVHSASYPINNQAATQELRKEFGFGKPDVLDNIIQNDLDECTMVFCHTLDKGKNIVSLDFPFPTSLVEDGRFYGDITITLVVNPVLNANQGSEYCQSQVDVLLETYDHVVQVDLAQAAIMRNEPRMSSDSKNVLSETLYRRASLKTEYLGERILIEKGVKFQPIKKYHVNLEDMTAANKQKVLSSNKKWALKLEGLYRHAAELSRIEDGVDISQEVVVIITIKDTKHRGIVYSECLQLLEERGYIHQDISVHQNINIDVDDNESSKLIQ